MQNYQIALRNTYKIPEYIKNVTSDEWEIVFTFISNLLHKHNSITRKTINAHSDREEVEKYETVIKELKCTIEELSKKNKEDNVLLLQRQEASISDKYAQEFELYKKKLTESHRLQMRYVEDELNVLQNEKKNIKFMLENEITERLTKDFTFEKKLLEKEIESVKRTEQFYLDKVETYKSELCKLQNSVNSIIKDTKAEMENLYQNEINATKAEHNKLRNDVELIKKETKAEMEKQYQSKIESLQKVIEEYNSSNVKLISECRESSKLISDQVKDSLKPILKMYVGSNEEKGTAGENLIANILRSDRYTGSTVYDTSSQTARGDLLFKHKHLRCMLEIKNKKTITKDDVEKFERDVRESINSENTINCAMFVSLQTDQIYGKPKDIFQVDFINGIPVIYMYITTPTDIYYSVSCLEHIVKSTLSTSEENLILIKHFKAYYNNIKSMQDYFFNMIQIKQREIKQLTKHLNTWNNIYEQTSSDYTKLSHILDTNPVDMSENKSDIQDEHNPEVMSDNATEISDIMTDDITNYTPAKNIIIRYKSLDNLKKLIYKFYIEKMIKNHTASIDDICKHFSINTADLDNFGGHKALINEFKLTYISSIITDELAKKILTYKSTHGEYPNRAILTKIFISDLSLRKLSSVLEIKRGVTNYIYNYIDNNYDTATEAETDEDDTKVEPEVKLDSKIASVINAAIVEPTVELSETKPDEVDEPIDELINQPASGLPPKRRFKK